MINNKNSSFKAGIVLTVAAVAICLNFKETDLRDGIAILVFLLGEYYLLFKAQLDEER